MARRVKTQSSLAGRLFLSLSLIIFFGANKGSALPSVLRGIDLRSGTETEIPLTSPDKKGTVLVFLSIECPCSQSHQPPLAELAAQHPEFTFVGIHSNKEEPLSETRKFFSDPKDPKRWLPFPVLEDKGQAIANEEEIKAFKTPHVFVVDSKGSIVYRGAMDNSHEASTAKKHYLAMALDAIVSGHNPDPEEVPPLGCVISR